MLEHLVLLARL